MMMNRLWWLVSVLGVAAVSVEAAETRGAPVISVTQSGSQLEARVTQLERKLENQSLMDIFATVQRLQEEVQKLRGDLEVQANELEGIKKRQRDLYLDIDRRLQQGQSGGAATAMPLDGGAVTAAAPAADPAAEQAIYQQAFNLLKDARYEEAITAFRAHLASYPNGKFSDNSQYWVGEAHYVLRRFKEAVEEFNKVVNNFPQSSKVPDSLLKLGFTHYELNDWAQARANLEKVVSQHPQSTAARLADQRLQRMRSEGR